MDDGTTWGCGRNRKTRYAVTLVALWALGLGCRAENTRPDSGREDLELGSTEDALTPGWHLLPSETGPAALAQMVQRGALLFAIDQGYDPSQGRVVTDYARPESALFHQSHWAYVPWGNGPQETEGLTPPRPGGSKTMGGYFIEVGESVSGHKHPSFEAYIWDAAQQAFQSTEGAPLDAGNVYWVRGAAPCDPGDGSIAGVDDLLEACGLDPAHFRIVGAGPQAPVAIQSAPGFIPSTQDAAVFDPAPPAVSLLSKAKQTIFERDHTLAGHVLEPHLTKLVLVDQRTGHEEVLSVESHRFKKTLSLFEGINRFTLRATGPGQNTSRLDIEWIFKTVYDGVQPTRPPSGLEAWDTEVGAKIRWKKPTQLAEGSSIPPGVPIYYQIYRDGERLQTTTSPEFEGPVPTLGQAYEFYVTALVTTSGGVLESERSSMVSVQTGSKRLTAPGAFEEPSMVQKERRPLARPEMAFTETAEGVTTYLAYIVQGDGQKEADRIRILRSETFAKQGSWTEASKPVLATGPNRRIAEVSISVAATELVVVWLEQSESLGSQIISVRSTDGGEHFTPPQTLRSGAAWKRDLDSAFDRLGQHHFVWAEANKVYYLQDFEGELDETGSLLNVFDQRKRWVNYDSVKYRHTHHQKCADGEGCCASSYDDSYSLAVEQKGADLSCDGHGNGCQTERFGLYFERVEEAFVETPSLEVSHDAVSIVARQTRLFDNYPYPNPSWTGLDSAGGPSFWGPKVKDANWLFGPKTCAPSVFQFQMGFRHASRSGPYQCLPEVPLNADALLLEEQSAPLLHQRKEAFYAYDPRRGHPLSWYQFLYGGMWSEEDVIQVAQRPIEAGAWSIRQQKARSVPRLNRLDTTVSVQLEQVEQEVEVGWRRGTWHRTPWTLPLAPGAAASQFEETLQRWRISTVDRFVSERAGEHAGCGEDANPPLGPVGPSYPKLASRGSQLVLVYEKGTSSNPNAPKNNPIYFASSDDGGQTWSTGSEPLAHGYMPSVGIAQSGEIAVLYYEPHPENEEGSPGRIRAARRTDGPDFRHELLNVRSSPKKDRDAVLPTRPIHSAAHGASADRTYGVPILAAHNDLFVAAWVGQPEASAAYASVMTTRASAASATVARAKRVVVTAEGPIVRGQPVSATMACVDHYDVLAEGCDVSSTFLALPGDRRTPLSDYGSTAGTLNGIQRFWVSSTSGHPRNGRADSSSDSRSGGHTGSGSSAESNLGPDSRGALGPSALQRTGEDVALAMVSEAGAPWSTTLQLTTLEDSGQSEQEMGLGGQDASGNHRRAGALRDLLYDTDLSVQREYQEVQGDPDSLQLARYGRAWAYSQGIVLAQFSRLSDARAIPLAQSICDRAVVDKRAGQTVLKGWHFSWNTIDDDWKDARLVTGANAWVLHGLGRFLGSPSAQAMSEDARRGIQKCYLQGLAGLELALAKDLAKDEAARWLMTAGTTTLGLKNAEHPDRLGFTADPGSAKAENLRIGDPKDYHWAYYDILDVIGYDTLRIEGEPKIQSFYRHQDGPMKGDRIESSFKTYKLTEDDGPFVQKLKEPARATNVVTEHNLDMLSVLNHALDAWARITQDLGDKDVPTTLSRPRLQEWRDNLRDAIFSVLWNEEEGRFHTGGAFDSERVFVRSEHSAVDNCSWLSLSVDYEHLPAGHRRKLARCLQWTIDTFVRDDLIFREKPYRGAFYFPKSFKDPYIEQSGQQEELYHLEATTGLILGLLYFADALEDEFREEADRFRAEAARLWSVMQDFTRENGAPYSTVRIQDLMTQLPSATAAIWFIDVFDYYDAAARHQDRPLRNYVHDVGFRSERPGEQSAFPLGRVRQQVQEVWTTLATSAQGEEPKTPKLLVESAGLDPQGEPAWGRARFDQDDEDLVVQLISQKSSILSFTLNASGGLDEAPQPVSYYYQARVMDGADSEVQRNYDRYRTYNYAPVNITDLKLTFRVAPKDTFFLLGLLGHRDFAVTASGTAGPLPKGHENFYYVLLSVMVDGQEWILGRAALNEDGSFAFSEDIGTSENEPNLTEGRPVARLIRFSETDRSFDWLPPGAAEMIMGEGRGYRDEMVAATGFPKKQPSEEEHASALTFTASGLRGEWYFHQHAESNKVFLKQDAIALMDRASGNIIHEQFGERWRFRPHALVPTESLSLGEGASCVLRGGQCHHGFAGGCKTEAEAPFAGACMPVEGTAAVCCGAAPPRKEMRITYLEDQAWSILAALSRGEMETADRWVDGLLSTLVHIKNVEGPAVQFAHAVETDRSERLAAYFETGSQMLALYALGEYMLRRSPADPQRGPLRQIFADVLSTLRTMYRSPETWRYAHAAGWPGGLKQGLAGEGVDLGASLPVFHLSSLKDHVYAFFAYRIGTKLFDEDTELGAQIRRDLSEHRTVLELSFWDLPADGPPPRDGHPVLFAGKGRLPRPTWAEYVEALALYGLYDLVGGAGLSARRVLELLTTAAEQRPQEKRPRGVLSPGPAEVLFRRAAAAIDPRQEELAWNVFARLLAERPEGSAASSLLLVAENPNGLWGVHTGSMLGLRSPALTPDDAIRVDARLSLVYTDTLFSLLAADHDAYPSYLFDAAVSQLNRIEFLIEAINDRIWDETGEAFWDTQAWAERYQASFDDRLLATVARLKNLCQEGLPRLIGDGKADGESMLELIGVRCTIATSRFVKLLRDRTGGEDPALLLPILDHPNDGFELTRLTARLYHPPPSGDNRFFGRRNPVVFGPRYGSQRFTAGSGEEALDGPELIRTRWQHAVSELANTRSDTFSKPWVYNAHSLDFIAMNNPAAPAFWSPEALELRLLLPLETDVRYMLDDLSLSHQVPADTYFYLSGEEPTLSRRDMEANVLQLRRFINQEASGDLPYLARTSSVSEARIHHMMRTGKLRETDFSELLASLPMDEDQASRWANQMVFLPPDSPTWVLPELDDPVSPFDLHLESMGNEVFADDHLSLAHETGGVFTAEEHFEPIVFHRMDLDNPNLNPCHRMKVAHHSGREFDKSISAGISDHSGEWFRTTPVGLISDGAFSSTFFFCVDGAVLKELPADDRPFEAFVTLELSIDDETYAPVRHLTWTMEDGLYLEGSLFDRVKTPANGCQRFKLHNTQDEAIDWHIVSTGSVSATAVPTISLLPSDKNTIAGHSHQELELCTTLSDGPEAIIETAGNIALIDETHWRTTTLKVEAYRQGLVAHYPFDEDGFRDHSGHGNKLDMSNGGRLDASQAGRFGRGLSGEGHQWTIKTPSLRFETSHEPFSVSLWLASVPENQARVYVLGSMERADPSLGRGWGIALEPDGHLVFVLRADEERSYEARSSFSVDPADGWVHVALTWDGAGTARFFQEGHSPGPAASQGFEALPIFLDSEWNDWVVVKNASDADAWAFHGMLDEVRIYRGVLTEEAVSHLARGEAPAAGRTFVATPQSEAPPDEVSRPNITVETQSASASLLLHDASYPMPARTATALLHPIQFTPPEKSVSEPQKPAEPEIPDWIRNNALWWAQGAIEDEEFINGIQYLVRQRVLTLPRPGEGTLPSSEEAPSESSDGSVPGYVKTVAELWANRQISNQEFINGMQYLVKEGIITVPTSQTPSDLAGLPGTGDVDQEITVRGYRGGYYESPTLHLDWGGYEGPLPWVAEWRRDGWLEVTPESGSTVASLNSISLAVDEDAAYALEPRSEPYEEIVRIRYGSGGEDVLTLRVLLYQEDMPTISFRGWRGGLYDLEAQELKATRATQSWYAQWDKQSWLGVHPSQGTAVEFGHLRFSVNPDVAERLEPRTEPYEEIVSVLTESGDFLATMRVLLYQRGSPSTGDDGFQIPPGLSWCTSDAPPHEPDEVECLDDSGSHALCPEAGCANPVSFRLRWFLNGRPFSGFEPMTVFGIEGLMPGRHTNGTWVEKEEWFPLQYQGGELGPVPANLDLNYVGTREVSPLGEVTLVEREPVDSGGPGLASLITRFDRIVRDQSEFFDMSDVPPYRAFLLPQEMYVATMEGLRKDPSVAWGSDAFTTGFDMFIDATFDPIEIREFELSASFSHEHIHWLLENKATQFPNVPLTDYGLCLVEGLAEAVPVHLGHKNKVQLDPDAIIPGFKRVCTAYSGPLSEGVKGRCMMWHLQEAGYFEGAVGSTFIRNLFFPERPLDVDTCALDEPATGAALIVYFTEAWRKAAEDPKDLTPVVKKMGVRGISSYEDALRVLEVGFINPL